MNNSDSAAIEYIDTIERLRRVELENSKLETEFRIDLHERKMFLKNRVIELREEVERLLIILQMVRTHGLESLGGIEYSEKGLVHTINYLEAFASAYRKAKKQLEDSHDKFLKQSGEFTIVHYFTDYENFEEKKAAMQEAHDLLKDYPAWLESHKETYFLDIFDKVGELNSSLEMFTKSRIKSLKQEKYHNIFFGGKTSVVKDIRFRKGAESPSYIG